MNPYRNGKTPESDSCTNERQLPSKRGGHQGGRELGTQDLVENGVIDQETADKIATYFREQRAEGQIDKLVEAGVVDQETADKIETWLKSKMAEAPTEGEVPPEGEAPEDGDLPPEKPEGGDPALASLVEQGVITQEQADAIEPARAAVPTVA